MPLLIAGSDKLSYDYFGAFCASVGKQQGVILLAIYASIIFKVFSIFKGFQADITS
jgi:hypothetical protein